MAFMVDQSRFENCHSPNSCPNKVSIPKPLSTVSLPTVSLPLPPTSLSLPSPVTSESSPSPPFSESLPPPPMIESLPPSPLSVGECGRHEANDSHRSQNDS